MQKAELLERLAKDQLIKKICKDNSYNNDWQDVYQTLFVKLCEMPESELIRRYENGILLWWIIKVAKTQSAYMMRKTKNHCQLITDEILELEYNHDVDKRAELVERELLKLSPLERDLFITYIAYGNARKIALEAGVEVRSLQRRIKAIKEQINENISRLS